jgi:hypothetical protein
VAEEAEICGFFVPGKWLKSNGSIPVLFT